MFSSEWDDVRNWHFAIACLQTNTDKLELWDGARLMKLKTLPTPTELTQHLTNSLVAGVMQRYCGEGMIQHELVIDAEKVVDSLPIYEHAEHILSALRIRTEAEILCPAVCERSWTDLRDAKPFSCHAELMESAMYSHQINAPTTISVDDVSWIEVNLPKLVELEGDDRFKTALDALSTYLHAASYRMMTAQLWAGVESIFDAQVNQLRNITLGCIAARGTWDGLPRTSQTYS